MNQKKSAPLYKPSCNLAPNTACCHPELDSGSQMKKSAFTLIELLVVIVIIGILATIGVASFNSYAVRARDAKLVAEFSQIEKHIITHTTANGSFPSIAYEGGVHRSGSWYYITESIQDSIEGLHLTDPIGVLTSPTGFPEIGIAFNIYAVNSDPSCGGSMNGRQFVVKTWFEDATTLNKFSLSTLDSKGVRCRDGLYQYEANSIVRVFHEGNYQ